MTTSLSDPDSSAVSPDSDMSRGFLVWMPIRAGIALVTSSSLSALLIASTAAAGTATGSTAPSIWEATTGLGVEVAGDANWLLPTLFAAILAVLAILAGQNFSDLSEQDRNANRRRLAAASWVIAGTAVATLALSFVSLANASSAPRHLWPSSIVSALILAAAFWGGSIVLGSPQQQLQVLANSKQDLDRYIRATPIEHEHGRPVLRLIVSLGTLAVTATTIAGALAAVATTLVSTLRPTPVEEFGVTVLISAGAACGGAVQTALISQLRDNTATWWGGLLSAGPSALIAVAPVVILGSSIPNPPLARAEVMAVLTAYALPMIAAFAPRRLLRGWTPRGALDGLRFRRFRKRERRHERERLRLEQTLDISRSRIGRHVR